MSRLVVVGGDAAADLVAAGAAAVVVVDEDCEVDVVFGYGGFLRSIQNQRGPMDGFPKGGKVFLIAVYLRGLWRNYRSKAFVRVKIGETSAENHEGKSGTSQN